MPLMYQIERARPNIIRPKYASHFADRKSYCTNMPRYIQKSFSGEKITASEKERKTRNTFPPQECLRHFHHTSDDFTLFDSPGDPPLTSPYIVEEKTSSFTRRVARDRERERGESPSFQPIVPFTNVTDKDDPRCHFKYQTPP